MNKLTEQFFRAPTSVFTHSDVCALVDGTKYSRHGLIKRAIAGGEIINIRRGLYCLTPKYQNKTINTYSLAEKVYGPSYISMESALSYHNWIPEAVYSCTNACLGSNKDFNTPLGLFTYKRVPQKILYLGVEHCTDQEGNYFFMASPAKALIDYLYIHRLNWTDINEPINSMRIDPDIINAVTSKELESLLNNYNNKRIKTFLTAWISEMKS